MTRDIAKVLLIAGVLIAAGCRQKQEPPLAVKSPTLANRQAIIQLRDSLARIVLPNGGTETVYVFIGIDEKGNIVQPEVKPWPADSAFGKAALLVVGNMHFNPGIQNGKPKAVLMKIPVRFSNPAQ